MRLNLALVISLILFSARGWAATSPSAAERLDPAQSTSMVTPETDEVLKKKTSGSVGVSHNGGFYETTEQTTSFFASLSHKFNKKQSASVAQSFNQKYHTNPRSSDTGFGINDTVLGFNQSIAEDFWAAKWGAKLSATLPVSERSKRVDAITASTASLSISKSLFEKKLLASLSPSARYYFYEYTTTPSGPGDGGGNPLPQYLFGIMASLSYKATDKFSITGTSGWTNQHLYKTRYENIDPEFGFTAPPKNSYSLSLGVDYEITPKWNASATYEHGDRYEKSWGNEYLIFNDRITTWSAGVSHSF